MQRKQKPKLKWNMIRLLILAWIGPMVLITTVMFVLLNVRSNHYMKESVILSADKAAESSRVNIETALSDSRGASYMLLVEKSYEEYLATGDDYKLYTSVTGYLSDQYRFNVFFHTAMIVFNDYPDRVYYTKNDMELRHAYDKVRNFQVKAKDILFEKAKTLDTKAMFITIDDQIYLVRNMMDRHFKPFALLVMEINPTNMFQSMESVRGYSHYGVYVDGEYLSGAGSEEALSHLKKDYENGYCRGNAVTKGEYGNYTKETLTIDGYHFDFVVEVGSNVNDSERMLQIYIFLIILILLIPLFLMILRFFDIKINSPVNTLLAAAKEIENGKLGYQIEEIESSEEMGYLSESFNHMSKKLKHQFDTIYSEELALRDAKINALQSQINPHFLNNTLEIINWEARIGGDYNVSTMIEALSTMLEATMNRSKKEMVYLAEELDYMNAYLFIAGKRFGEKLRVTRDIDESLTGLLVPRLIIQPIVENAVEHGRAKDNLIRIKIQIQMEEEYLIIRITNQAKLSDEDRNRIERLLCENPEDASGAINIGIRNVNLRLKMIYGQDCGLTIIGNDNDETISTLRLKPIEP